MINVSAFAVDVEDLTDLNRLPSVDQLRPSSCPRCGAPSCPPGKSLGIVGHGTYRRQVRGLAPGDWAIIFVRRYLCRCCGGTISVLPDELLPRRWYTGGAILRVLVDVLVRGITVAALRSIVGPGERSPHWTSPGRWASQLGTSLWQWRAAELANRKSLDAGVLIQRLMNLAGADIRGPSTDLEAAARFLVTGTSHA